MKRILFATELLIACLMFSINGFSDNYMFEKLNVPVSHSNVITITQDKQGFMWFGTRNGLNRYDGANMVTFSHQNFDSTSLANNLVNALRVSSGGLIWVGTYDGLSIFDPEQFKFGGINNFFSLNENPEFGDVLSIDTCKNSELWVATIANGLYCFDTAKGVMSWYKSDKNNGGICDNWVNVVKCDSKGRVWAGTRSGLSLIEKDQNQVSNYQHNPNDVHSLSDNYVTSIIEDVNGNIWVATANMGLQKVVEEKGRILFERVPFYSGYYSYNPGFSVLSVLCDREGNIWVGTENGGLYIIDKKTNAITRYMNDPFDASSLAGNSIYTIFQSRDGIVWIGTYNQGICYYDPNQLKFEHYFENPTNSNFLNCSIIKCLKYEGNKLIIGTDGGGLTLVDMKTRQSVHFIKKPGSNSISSNTIMSLLPEGSSGIWLGTWDAGLNYFDRVKGTFKEYSTFYSQHESLKIEHVTAFCRDSKGTVWIGTFGHGLNYYSPYNDKVYHFSGRDAGNSVFDTENIHCMLETSSGDLLLGTMDGLYRIKNFHENPSVVRYKYQPDDSLSLSNNMVICLLEDAKNQIWVGTIGGGLNLFDLKTETFRHFSEKEGLPENTIRGMICDEQGTLWISTNLGIARMNPDNLEIKAYRSKELQSMGEFLYSSTTIDPDNHIYFGGSNGLIRFKPDQIVENQNIPPVYFSDFRLFNKSVKIGGKKSPLFNHISLTKSIVLDYNQSFISIDFVALNYTEPAQNQYAYYLEGFEPDWNYCGHTNSATYTNLDPGKYVFKVKASNNDGIWNPVPATLSIRVKSPWWVTWWALTCYIFILSLIFYFILRFIRKQAFEQEQIRAERIQNQNLQDLQDRKLQFFTNISHEIRTPLSLIITPLEEIMGYKGLGEEVKKKIHYAAENSKFLLKLVNQLLDFRKLDNSKMDLNLSEVSINQLLIQIIDLHRLRAEEKNIELVFEPLPADDLFFVDPDKIEKIIHNLLSNAVKFSYTGSLVFVRAFENKTTGKLVVEVIDHGPGLDEDQIPLIFERFYQEKSAINKGGTGIGLALCKELAGIHRGTLEVESNKGEGSCFRLVLPARYDYYKGMEKVFFESRKEKLEMPEPSNDTIDLAGKKIPAKNFRYSMIIVEDDPQIRSYLFDEFSKIYKTYLAENGKEALNLIVKNQPDIIVSDILMPEMDGLELCTRIKANLETSHIPFVVLTAKVEIEHQIDGLETGADAYVPKPFNMRYLKALIKNILEKRSNMFKAFSQKSIIIPSEFSTNKVDEEFLHKVIQYIESNIEHSELSVDMLAQNMNLSRSQVYRKIKALTNLTANEFIRQIRLKKSLKLLSEGNMNISEIAYSVGFSSQSYFTRSFKEYYGKSPSELKGQQN